MAAVAVRLCGSAGCMEVLQNEGGAIGAPRSLPFAADTIDGEAVEQGGALRVEMDVVNGAGLSALLVSNSVLADWTPASPGAVLAPAHASALTGVVVEVVGFADPQSGIFGIELCGGATPGADDVMPCANVQQGVEVSLGSLQLNPLTCEANEQCELFLWARATNGVGLTSHSNDAAVTLDTAAPLAGQVFDGLPAASDSGELRPATVSADGALIASSSAGDVFDGAPVLPVRVLPLGSGTALMRGDRLGAHWLGFADAAGALAYQVCFGSAPGLSDIVPCVDVGPATAAVTEPVLLVSDGHYFATVIATDAAGNTASASSVGVRIAAPISAIAAQVSVSLDATHVSSAAQAVGGVLVGAIAAFRCQPVALRLTLCWACR